MSRLKIPLDFSPGSFYEKNYCYADHNEENRDKNLTTSISEFLKLLVNSPNGSFKPDERFGFSLKNCQFMNADSKDEIRGKKIGGKSDNINNYAKDLEKAITLFETRLKNLETKTEFDKKLSKLTISVKGIIVDEFREYKQDIEFYIWKKQ